MTGSSGLISRSSQNFWIPSISMSGDEGLLYLRNKVSKALRSTGGLWSLE